jgi:hypothetical protein
MNAGVQEANITDTSPIARPAEIRLANCPLSA